LVVEILERAIVKKRFDQKRLETFLTVEFR
jgi:hypothetical protein